jgi:predicted tellurium resistance membrane protein TerC
MNGIDLLVNLGIVCLVFIGVVAILNHFGIVIPQVVFVILGCIAGILLLVWGARFLQGAF